MKKATTNETTFRAVKACYGILWLGTAGRARNAEDWKVEAWLSWTG